MLNRIIQLIGLPLAEKFIKWTILSVSKLISDIKKKRYKRKHDKIEGEIAKAVKDRDADKLGNELRKL